MRYLLTMLAVFNFGLAFGMDGPCEFSVSDLPERDFDLIANFFPLGGQPARIKITSGGNLYYKNYAADLHWIELSQADPVNKLFITAFCVSLYNDDNPDDEINFDSFLDYWNANGLLVAGSAVGDAARIIYSVAPKGGDLDN